MVGGPGRSTNSITASLLFAKPLNTQNHLTNLWQGGGEMHKVIFLFCFNFSNCIEEKYSQFRTSSSVPSPDLTTKRHDNDPISMESFTRAASRPAAVCCRGLGLTRVNVRSEW